jgi:hypothetical protein
MMGIATEKGVVSFDAQLTGGGTLARVTCRNRTLEPLTLWIPTPEGGLPSAEYGVSVHILETAEGPYRLFPSSGPYWTAEGVAVGDTVEVGPGAFKAFVCNLGRLKSRLPSAESVRLVFHRGNRELSRFEAALPERPTGEGSGTFRRVPPTPNTPPQTPAGPQAEESGPTSGPSSDEPGVLVRFTGFMGGKAALRVALEGEARERTRFAEPGDEIGAGWLLHEIDEASGFLVMRHAATQREVRVPRGAASVVLKP